MAREKKKMRRKKEERREATEREREREREKEKRKCFFNERRERSLIKKKISFLRQCMAINGCAL